MSWCPETKREEETTDAMINSSGRLPYEDNAQKADDNRSSAYVLLLIGTLGLLFVVLCLADIIPLKIGNPYLFYGVMSAVFILFVVTGAVSMRNARFFAIKAKEENSLKTAILDWCRQNLQAEEIDAAIENRTQTPAEVLYFKRAESMKEKLNYQFVNLDQDFLDALIDTVIYEMVFEDESK